MPRGAATDCALLVCGESGTLEWWQEQPEILTIHALGGSIVRLRRGDAGLSADAQAVRVRRAPPATAAGIADLVIPVSAYTFGNEADSESCEMHP